MDLTLVLNALRRSAWRIALASLTALAAALAVASLRPADYEAVAQIPLSASGAGTGGGANGDLSPQEADRRVANELVIAGGGAVAQSAADTLGRRDTTKLRKQVVIRQLTDTDIITFTARERSPARAVDVAKAFAGAYSQANAAQAIQSLTSSADQLTARLRSLSAGVDRLQSAQSDTNTALRSALLEQYKNVAVQQQLLLTQAGALTPTPVAEPDLPTDPRGPAPLLLGVGALVLAGLASGAFVALRAQHRGVLYDAADVAEFRIAELAPARGVRRRLLGGRERAAAQASAAALRSAAAALALREPVPRVIAVLPVGPAKGFGGVATGLARQLQLMGQRATLVSHGLSTDDDRSTTGHRVGATGATQQQCLPAERAGSLHVQALSDHASPEHSLVARRQELRELAGSADAVVVPAAATGDDALLRVAVSAADVTVLVIALGKSRRAELLPMLEVVRSVGNGQVSWMADPGSNPVGGDDRDSERLSAALHEAPDSR